jgi:hypothetical protein
LGWAKSGAVYLFPAMERDDQPRLKKVNCPRSSRISPQSLANGLSEARYIIRIGMLTAQWPNAAFKSSSGIAFKGKYCGQIQKWLAFRFEGDDTEIQINSPPDGRTAEFDEWGWKVIYDLPNMIVPFKRGVYEQVVAEFRDITQLPDPCLTHHVPALAARFSCFGTLCLLNLHKCVRRGLPGSPSGRSQC